MRHILRILLLVLIDAGIAAAGAWLLWLNAATTVVDGSVAGNITAMMATGILIVFRQLVLGPRRANAPRSMLRTHIRTERALILIDLALLAGIFTAWFLTNNYVVGWVACFSSMLLMLAAGSQLVYEVTGGRVFDASSAQRSLFVRRLVAPETLRLLVAAAAIVGVVLTAPIHRWQPEIINPLIVMLAVTVAFAGVFILLLRAFQFRLEASGERRSVQDDIPSVTAPTEKPSRSDARRNGSLWLDASAASDQ